MGFEVLGAPGGNGVHPGQTVNFTFQNQVQAYALGIWAFTMTYGDGDHYVRAFSLDISPGQLDALAGNVVSAVVSGELRDASGHVLDSGNSTVYPVCIALTQDDDGNTILTTTPAVQDGQSNDVQLPGSSGFTFMESFMSGFDLAYADKDHQVQSAGAGCGLTYQGSTGFISSRASMTDAKGDDADIATVTPSVLATTDPAPGIGVQEVTNQTDIPLTVSFPQMPTVSGAYVVIRAWNVAYDSPHNVLAFAAGSFGPPTISGDTVTLPDLQARVWDDSGHAQDDSSSSVTALVIALP